jgi:aspartyl-tRNA(Asn)/glutamyl-tRNA(Gln) amidotransferase subunit A
VNRQPTAAPAIAASLAETAAALCEGSITARTLTDRCLDAAEGADLTGFVRLRATQARNSADACDAAAADDRILHGIPIAHKDMFYRAGELSECGSRILQGFTPAVTATVLTRLDQAGAIDLGALHMAEFALSPTGFNAHLGHGRNPWSREHVTGGSSSGSGVVTAARQVCAALGSDTGGSVRIPAVACGVTGLKPTQHLVSVHGVMPLAPSLDCVGFLAQTARDCARLLSAVSGPDVHDPSCLATDAQDYESGIELQLGAETCIAVPEFPPEAPLSVELRAMLDDAVQVLRLAGASIRRVPLPDLSELGALASLVLGSEAASIHRSWLASRPDEYGTQVRRRIERGLLYPATRYVDALRLRPILLRRFLNQCLPASQALLLPVLPYAVPGIEETTRGTEAEIEARFGGFSYWTRAINYLGLPALALPAGFTGNGLPNGFQLVGRPLSEAALLRIGHQYQCYTDWHRRIPAA